MPSAWLLAGLLAALAWQAQAQSSAIPISRASASLALPHPAPDRSQDLPAVFRKESPASIADLNAIQKQVEALVLKVSPAVVAVELDSDVGRGTVASGSGVVISADGLVLTAGHIYESPNRKVRFEFPDGKIAVGKTLGVNAEADTGLMLITDPGPWPRAAIGDLEKAHLGDWVLALGHPGGFDVKRSLVVRLGRLIRVLPGVLQTDCTISPGDSGGPLFDMQGRVIGIHSAISSEMTENYHVPITEFFDTWHELAAAQVSAVPSSRPLAYSGAKAVNDSGACRVASIDKNSPAANAGLKPNDLVLSVEGRTILAAASFDRWVAESSPGQTLVLQVKRDGELLSLKMKLQSQPQSN